MATRNSLRVFVGNVPWTLGKRELKEYFSQFGHVVMANIAVDKETGWTKGYGFIKFSSRDGYISATNKETHTIEGNTVIVHAANEISASDDFGQVNNRIPR